MIHDLKADPAQFGPVLWGLKRFEIRKNDRGFEVRDVLRLHETRYTAKEMSEGKPLEYTGCTVDAIVLYMLKGPHYAIPAGYCVMSIEKL